MLTGKRPFTGETQSDVQARILLAEPEFGEEFDSQPELKGIIEKALAKDLETRYQETHELIKDLELAENQLNKSHESDIHYSFIPQTPVSPENKQAINLAPDNKIDQAQNGTENYSFMMRGIFLVILFIFLISLFYSMVRS